MSTQTKAEKLALNAAWKATPEVQALTAALRAHAAADGHGFTPDGMTSVLAFASAWVSANGPLPVSGIICD